MFWFGAVVSLCYIPGTTGAYIATQWPLLGVVLSFDLLWTYLVAHWPWLARLLPFYPARQGPVTVFHVLGLAFIAYAFARWPYSPAPYASVFGLMLVAVMGLSLWFGTTVTNIRGLYAGLAVGGVVSSVVAISQYFGWHSVPVTAYAPAGIYVNGVQQGAVLALVVVALVSERMWVWVPPLLPGIALAQSRGAWIALAVGLLACSVRRIWVFSLVGVAAIFYLLSPLNGSDVQRMQIWQAAWDNLTLFGMGPGIFYNIVLPINGVFSLYPEYAHNDALQLAFEYGVGAALPFAIMAYALWRTDAREWPVVLAFVTAGCYSMPLYMPIASFLALVAVGRILRLHGLASRDSVDSGSPVVLRRRSGAGTGGQVVPLASYHTAKG